MSCATFDSGTCCSRWTVRHLLLCGVWVIVAGSSADALEIVDARWGFDGKIVRNRFNVLSILVDNPLPDAFDGELWLRKRISSGTPVDAPLVESVYVGPFARRWVQFYPYVGNNWETFGLQQRSREGRRTPEMDLSSPRVGWPARVIINSDGVGTTKGLPVKGLPDVLFPPFVTATDALQAVLIDSVPNWDEPRRTAFLNWLYLGGVAYVLHTPAGTFPEFPTPLGVLAGPLDENTFGAGRVFRIHQSRRDLSKETLSELFAKLPKRMRTQNDGTMVEDSPFEDDLDEDGAGNSQNQFQDASDPLSGTSFLSQLKKLTRPKHNWPLLHLMFWMYIALVFPGCWLIGRRLSDYRLVYLALLATVGVFSVLFAVVGQRGYGEATAVNSVAIVRPLPDGTADVSQWSNAFVTSGGNYEIRHPGIGTLYSTCNITEAVNGLIQNGADAKFLVDIPPFSSREFADRMQAKCTTPKFDVVQHRLDAQRLVALTLECTPPLPTTAENLVLLHGKQFYSLSRNGTRLELGTGLGEPAGYLRVEQYDAWQYQYGGAGWGEEERPATELYRELFTPLISRSVDVSRLAHAAALDLPVHIVRVFYAAPMNEELFAQNPYLGKQAGWALYAIDVSLTNLKGSGER